MKQNRSAGISVGVSSILVVFVLLCLTTFATLSLVSSNADYQLTKKSAEHTSLFYQADNKAEEILADIDSALAECLSASADSAGYYALAGAKIGGMDGVRLIQNGPLTMQAQYSVPIKQDQQLDVLLDIRYPGAELRPRYAKRLWQVVITREYELEQESLGLFTGEELNLFS